MSNLLRPVRFSEREFKSKKHPSRLFLAALQIILISSFLTVTYAAKPEGNWVLAERERFDAPQYEFQLISKIPNAQLLPPQVVTITTVSESTKLLSYEETVRDILKDGEVSYKHSDIIYPNLDGYVANGANIRVISVKESTEIEAEEIPYQTKYLDDENLEYGTEQIAQAGVKGVTTYQYKLIYHDGVLTDKVLEKKESIQPIPEIISVGTKVIPKTLTLPDGSEFEYCREEYVKVTAYDPYCVGCSGRGITSLGYKLKKGIIAVDPNFIPLLSYVYIPGYGVGLAADTGGGVKGAMVDVGFASAQERLSQWGGTKYDNVYVACQAQ